MTIDYGIDFGTTNSAIAKWTGERAVVIRNNLHRETTPTVVYQQPRTGNFLVGDNALTQIIKDPANGHGNFKLKMGSNETFRFARSELELGAVGLAAKVLATLRTAAEVFFAGDRVEEAVITVPAAANMEQLKATKEAAALAGIRHCVLPLEPEAAALCYSRRATLTNGPWLVYDIGGGTFDAVIIRMEDGSPTLLGHEGNRHIGGQRIDADIVKGIFLPWLEEEYKLCGFDPNAGWWQTAFRQLRRIAEQAKQELSAVPEYAIAESDVFRLEGGEYVDLVATITQAQVEEITRPYVTETIACCRRLIDRLKSEGTIARNPNGILLVGGPTRMPWLRRQLEEETGLPIVTAGVDPMTVVAEGAAIIAGGEPSGLDKGIRRPSEKFGVVMTPEVGTSGTPRVEIAITAPEGREADLAGATLQLQSENAEIGWNSPLLHVPASRVVEIPELPAEGKVRHSFRVILRDRAERLLDTDPESLSYTRKDESEPFLLHSIGVGLDENRIDWMFKRGQPLPCEAEGTYPTRVEIRRTSERESFDLTFYEGEYSRADRNAEIGRIHILPQDLTADLPLRSEILIRLEIDRDRQITASAHHEPSGQRWGNVLQIGAHTPELETVRDLFDEAVKQAEDLKNRVKFIAGQPETAQEAPPLWKRIEEARIEWRQKQIENALAAGSAQVADHEVRELLARLDELEEALKTPGLMADNGWLIRDISDRYADCLDARGLRGAFESTRRGAMTAIRNRDPVELFNRRAALWTLMRQLTTTEEFDARFPDSGGGGKSRSEGKRGVLGPRR